MDMQASGMTGPHLDHDHADHDHGDHDHSGGHDHGSGHATRPGVDMGRGVEGLSGNPAAHFSNHGGASDPAAITKQNEHQLIFSSVEGHFVQNAARVHRAIASGSWFDPNTWEGGRIPGDDAMVYIPPTVDVVYDDVAEYELDVVYVKGGLSFAADVNTKMVVDTLVTAGGSDLKIGSEGDPVAATVATEIVIRADGTPVDRRSWDPGQFTKGIVTHGTVEIFGAEKASKLVLAEDASANDTTLVLQGSATGWAIGDTLVLAGTYTNPNGSDADNTRFHDEELKITGLTHNGNGTVTVQFENLDTGTNALRFDHTRPSGGGINAADLNIYVANLSRNVTIAGAAGEASMPENGGDVHTRGHVMFMHNPDVQVHHAAFLDLGRSDKAQMVDSQTNVRGRYGLHFHRTGAEDITQAPAEAIGVVVKGSPGWGLTHHQSHLNIINSVVYETVGSGIVAEAGDEIGLWRDNLVLKVTGQIHAAGDSNEGLDFWNPGNPNNNIEVPANSTLAFDFGRAEAYWVQGAGQILLENNVAASAATALTFFADSWELANKDAKTVAVGNLRLREEDGTVVETEAYRALKAAGFADGDRIAVGAAPPKGVDGFEASNIGTGAVFWLVQRNPDGDDDLNPIFVTGDMEVLAHDARMAVNNLTLWGITQNGILLQDSSGIDFTNITAIADGTLSRETGDTYALDDITGVALGEAGSSKITVAGLTAVGFADAQARLSFGPDFSDPTYIGGDGQDVFIAPKGSLTNDYMVGGAGDDYLQAEGGNDVLIGGEGNDVLVGSFLIVKDKLDQQAQLGVDRDVMIGGKGDDVFIIQGEDPWVDRIYGGPGYDTLLIKGGGIYGAAFNRFSAYEQSIEAIGPQQGDPFWRFTGTDTADHLDFHGAVFQSLEDFKALGGDDLYRGVDQDEAVYGGDGNDWISGMGGNDHLMGEAGDDILRGDGGRNWLEGGAGRDTFQAADEGIQIIRDFTPTEDRLEIAVPGVESLADLRVTTITWNPSNENGNYASGRNNETALYITWGDHAAPANGAFVTPADLTGVGVVVQGMADFAALSDRITLSDRLYTPQMDFTHPVWTPDLPAGIDPADLAPGIDPRRLVNDTRGPQTAADLGLTNTNGYEVVRASDRETAGATGSLHTSLDIPRSGNPIYGIGDDENNMVHGSDNTSDILDGGAGDDVLELKTGFDKAFGGPGDDLIRVGARINPSLFEEADIDMPDELYGGSGYDTLIHNRTLGLQNFSRLATSIEEIQATTIVGASGPTGDTNVLDFRGVALRPRNGIGSEQDVTIDARTGNDIVYGNRNNNTIYGGAGDDFLSGEGGNDVLDGGAGNDILRGGPGINRLSGGAGTNIFEVGANEQTTITDFTPGVDTLRLTAAIAQINRISEPGARQRDPAVISTELVLANGSTIRLDQVNPTQFSLSDVELVAAFEEPIAPTDWDAIDDPALRGERFIRPQDNSNPTPPPAPEPDPVPDPEPDPVPGLEPDPVPDPEPDPVPDPEPPSASPLLKLALVDADTDQVVEGYEDLGATPTIDLSTLDLTKFNLVALVNPDHADAAAVKSVEFQSNLGNRTESTAPYALFGDRNGDFSGKTINLGDFSVKVTAYPQSGAKGKAIATTDLAYTVISGSTPEAVIEADSPVAVAPPAIEEPPVEVLPIEEAPVIDEPPVVEPPVEETPVEEPSSEVPVSEPTPAPESSGEASLGAEVPLFTLALVNAEMDAIVPGYEDLGSTLAIDLSTLEVSQFNLVAVVNPDHPDAAAVKSIRFESNLGNRTESAAPYALFGDLSGDFNGRSLTTGGVTLQATAFTQKGAKGEAIARVNLNYTVTSGVTVEGPEAPLPPSAPTPIDDGGTPPIPDPVEPPAPDPVEPPTDGTDNPVSSPTSGDLGPAFAINVNRIAISADGNYHDKDDWAATAAALAMLAERGQQSRLVHYDYSSHLGQSGNRAEAEMSTSALEGADRFGFDRDVFFDDQLELAASVNSLKEAINASSASDRLALVLAGPAEVMWQGIRASDPSKHRHVTLISHSPWNNEHQHEPGHRNLEDILQDFPSLDYVKIRGQNAGLSSEKDLSEWQWLRNSADPNLQWLYSRLETSGKGDISDAGMVYYVITGDERGDSHKIKTFLTSDSTALATATEPAAALMTLAVAAADDDLLLSSDPLTADAALPFAPPGEGVDLLTGTVATAPLTGDVVADDWLTNYAQAQASDRLSDPAQTVSNSPYMLLEGAMAPPMADLATAVLGSDSTLEGPEAADVFGDGLMAVTGTLPLEPEPLPKVSAI